MALVQVVNGASAGDLAAENLYDSFEKVNSNTTQLGSTTGASLIGVGATNVEAALASKADSVHSHTNFDLADLTSAGAGTNVNYVPVSDGASGVDWVQQSSSIAGALSSSSILEYEFLSISNILPTNSGAVRIHSFADCFIKFGDETVTVGTDSIYFAAGTEVFGIPSGATHIAVKMAGEIGRVNVVGLDTDASEHLTDNAMLALTAGSSNITLPTSAAGAKARIFTMTDCFINFGSSSVTADETSLFFEAGTEIISIPSSATHIAAQRYSSDGGLYISGVA